VLDYAMFLLRRGRQEARATDVDVHFCRGDARAIPLRTASVDVVLLLANAFGYFADAAADQRLPVEAARVLRRGGRFLLDITDDEFLRQHFAPASWEATDDVVVCWKRELVDEVVRVREMVLLKRAGLWRDRTYAERLYSPTHLHALLGDVGFVAPRTYRDAFVFNPDDATDYGLSTHRMLITAVKG
jgi:D-alanine-D-alanine ligase